MTDNGHMFDLSQWPLEDRRQIKGVFTDIDDTLTIDGAISSAALSALGQLKHAGISVIAITGRPMGWSRSFALEWPVDAIVAENGAVALVGNQEFYLQDALTRSNNQQRMAQVVELILQALPHARVSQDSFGRETDIAIDHSEHHALDQQDIAKVVHIMQENGMTATVSSIHINGWYGDHNKLEGAKWIVQKLLARNLDLERNAWTYVGDSTNDQVMFANFANSVGVANIQVFAQQLQNFPRYITQSERGEGFAEVVDALLQARAETMSKE
jgi:HAD superfamily hydrolase (TIGR01484 family)